MVAHRAAGKAVTFERRPNGRLAIVVHVDALLPDGATMLVGVDDFELTKEDEAGLRAMLGGLVIPNSIPQLIQH